MIEGPLHSERDHSVEAEKTDPYVAVCAELQERVASLNEAFDIYPQVKSPNGEIIDPANNAEQALGKAQMLLAYLEGEIDKNAEMETSKETYEMEVVLRMVKEFIDALEKLLALRADLVNMGEAQGRKGVAELVSVLQTIANELLSSAERTRE